MEPEPAVRAHRDPRLLGALALALVFHGGLLLAGSFRRTYDAYVHIFFADHYARDWFSTWEPRWYTGFTTTSYPPGSHQAVALASRVVGLEFGFASVQLAAICLLVVGVYRFARVWVSPAAAGWAAILAALSSSVAEAVHTFGQLPTTFALGFLLNALPFAHRWINEGRGSDLVLAVVCMAATTAGHHVTTLFGSVFFLGPVVVAALVERLRAPLVGEPAGHPSRISRSVLGPLIARRVRRIAAPLVRATVLGVLVAAALVVVVLPYWLWSSSDPISQIPIPHGSRANFLDDTNAGLVFWAVPWSGLLLLLVPALVRGLISRAWPLAASILLLTMLGTGGTTPIPRLLLGGAFEILTLDRFTFWATIAVLPLAGHVVESLWGGTAATVVERQLGRRALPIAQTALALVVIATAVFAADLASFRRFQPDPIDPDPIVAFMEKDQHERWRYLTLGFGDQMAWLSANTTATTVDGNYHSARRLPELTTTPVERLEGAKFRGVPGLGSLQQFLAVPAKYHLKYVFSNDEFYDPLLAFSGWHRLERLSNGVVVWERSDVPPLPVDLPTREVPGWQRALWGTVPPITLVLAALGLVLTASGRRLPIPGWRTPAIWHRLDQYLAALSARVDGDPAQTRWQSWRRWRVGVGRAVGIRPSVRRRRLQVALVGAIVVAPFAALLPGGGSAPPGDVVEGYYEDLDFRRFDAAHRRLDPAERPGLEQFRLELSVSDGLVASYGKLDTARTSVVTRTGNRAVVRAELNYVTALTAHVVVVEHAMVRRSGSWFLTPAEVDLTVPPDQFLRRADVEFRTQGRRRVTAGTTALADVIDRPEIVTIDARLVREEGRWVVVGEVVNTDVDPGDLTITAELVDADGQTLARYDAAQMTVHEVLPKERVPFRVEFEGVAGALDVSDPAAGDFRPGATSDLEIDDDAVAGFVVSTKAVVSDRGPYRGLALQDLRVMGGNGVDRLVGTLRNGGTAEVTVPRLLLTFRDADDRVVWVENRYLDRAVRPQRSIEVDIALPSLDDLIDTGVPGTTYDSLLRDLADAWPATAGLLPLAGPSAASLDVTVDGFVREATS